MRLAADVSNWTGPLTLEALAAWRDQGVELVICQAVDPELPDANPTAFLTQVSACEQAGMPWQPYIYDYLGSHPWMERCLVLLDQAAEKGWLPHTVTVRGTAVAGWLDCEDVSQIAVNALLSERVIATGAHLARFDKWMAAHALPPVGVYSAAWWWNYYLNGLAAFAERPLWTAEHDGIADTSVFAPFGGWSACAIKQYHGTSTLAGVGNVNLDVLSVQEAAEMTDPATPNDSPDALRETPDDYPFPTWRESAIAYRGALDVLGQQLAAVQAQLKQRNDDLAEANRLTGLAEQRAADHTAQLALLQQIAAKLGVTP